MTIIFKAKTGEGYVMKVLAELLQNNIKTARFEIDDTGIYLCMMDNHKIILIELKLEAENFTVYKYRRTNKLFLGINMLHFHQMLKSIKKRDSVEFFINDKSPTDFGIKVIPKENNRVTTSYVKIQDDQNICISIPQGYVKPIIVPSGEYQKMCKGMQRIGNTINISAKGFQIKFTCDAGGVMKRVTEFGEPDEESDDESSDEEESSNNNGRYCEDFKTDQLTKITKLAGLGQTMQIYPQDGAPLLFRSSIGNLGKISIYIKSEQQLQREIRKGGVDSDDDSDY